MEQRDMDMKRKPEWMERHAQIAKRVKMDMDAGPKWITYSSYGEYMKKLHNETA